MTIDKLNAIIELLDNVTLDVNSAELKLLSEGHELTQRCSLLWVEAYAIKKLLMNEHDHLSQLKQETTI